MVDLQEIGRNRANLLCSRRVSRRYTGDGTCDNDDDYLRGEAIVMEATVIVDG
jgi:hypothetical protein